MSFQFENLADFMTMSGHGAFVWASYGATFLALLALVWFPYTQQKSSFIKIERQKKLEDAEQERLQRQNNE